MAPSRIAPAIPRQSQLVQDARRLILDAQGVAIGRLGLVQPPGGRRHVAQALQRLGRRGVERRGLSQIPLGRGPVLTVQIRVAALQVGQHRLRPQGHRAAEGLDGHRGLPGGQGAVALRHQPAEARAPAARRSTPVPPRSQAPPAPQAATTPRLMKGCVDAARPQASRASRAGTFRHPRGSNCGGCRLDERCHSTETS